MKKLTAVCLAFFLTVPAFAQNRTFLPKAEVESLATGKKWIHLRSADHKSIQWDLRSGGYLYGSGVTLPGRDSGTWLVNDQGQLCVKWRGRSVDRCVAVLKDGEKLIMVDSNDLNGVYAEFTVE